MMVEKWFEHHARLHHRRGGLKNSGLNQQLWLIPWAPLQTDWAVPEPSFLGRNRLRGRVTLWSGSEDEAMDAGEVGGGGGGLVAERGGTGGDGCSLIVADFEGDEGTGVEMGQGFGEEAFDDAEAVGAAVEGEDGIALDLGAERFDLRAGDVRQIGNDEIEGAGDFFEEVAAEELGVHVETRGVEAGEVEGVLADVGEDDFAEGPGFGEAEADAAGAGGHVEHADRRGAEFFEGEFDEGLSLGAWDESAVVADDFVTAEFDAAEEVLQGFAFATTAEEFAEGDQTGLGDGFVEAEVEIESAATKDVREEVLHVEPGFLDFTFLQVGGAGLEDFEEGLHGENDE